MADCSVHRGRGPSDARGIALIVVLLVMGLLTLLGATFLTIASTEHTIASNEGGVARAFNIAEAGLERGKSRIKTGSETSLDAFLTGTSPGPNLFTNVAFDGGTYTVVVEDDVDTGNDPNDDTNNRVFIRATGTFGTAQKQVRALIEKPPAGPPVPAPRGAGEVLTASYELGADPGGSFDGRDWTAPASISACVDINNCGTKISDAGTYGGFTNTNSGVVDLTGGGNMVGTGCLPPACAGTSSATASRQTDTSSPLTRWDSFIDAAKLAADRTLSVGGAWSGSYTWGTAAAPEVTVINMTSTINWSSTVNGAGVLIIESPGGTKNVVFQATALAQLNWQGLVIIRSPGEVQFELENANGRIRVFGQIVNRAATHAEIELHNNKSFVKYSSAGMSLVPTAVGGGGGGGTFTVLSWQEVGL
jgi:type II secretory pathway pseudopilin PulG